MHELSITQGILDIALEQARAANAIRITRINLTIGALAGVVDDCVQFYFEILSKETIAAGASLHFDRPATRVRCGECGSHFEPAELAWSCPSCGSQRAEIVQGRECMVNSIEVD